MHKLANVLDEAVEAKNLTRSCHQIAKQCIAENYDTKKAFKNLEYEILNDKFRLEEFCNTL